MALIRFTANHQDLSTDRGFQFKFFCDKCGNGHMTQFQTSITGVAGDILRGVGNVLGGFWSSVGNNSYEIQRAVGSKAHDDAFASAVEEAKQYFHQCTRCGKWVCPDVCWNAKANMCEECAPDYQEEFTAHHARAKTEAARQQLYERAQQTDYTSQTDMQAESVQSAASRPTVAPRVDAANAPSVVGLSCVSCGAVSNSKFCPECGQPMNAKLCCKACGSELEGKAKFCKECGAKIEYQS